MTSTMFPTRRTLVPALVAGLAASLALPLAHAADANVLDANVLDVYAGHPMPSWHVGVSDFEGRAVLSGPSVVVPKPAQPQVPASRVEARLSPKDGAADALTLKFTDAWYANVHLEGGAPLDLRPWIKDGTLEFDVDVIEMSKGGVSFKITCGEGCERKVPWLLEARDIAGRGWHHLSFAMSCFVRDGDSFGAVTEPFALEGSGSGEVSVANVRFVRHGQATTTCPDYRTQSVTPGILAQSWAMEWWVPRHEKKVAENRALVAAGTPPELVFIGDSITENWEKAGKDVWASHYAKYHAVNLGFGGDHTENVLWRLQHGELDGLHPKVVVMMIGTNNTGDRQEDPKTTAAGVLRLVQEVRTRVPDAKVLLLAIFPRDEKPDGPLRRLNDRVNTIIAHAADGKHVTFLDIDAALTNPDGTLSRDVMPDLLHPNEKGYGLWADHMAPTLATLLASH
jgi:beta-glucosidase